MEGVSLISDIVWIKRGVPSTVPQKVKLNAQEIRSLIQGDANDEDQSDSSELMDASSDIQDSEQAPSIGQRASVVTEDTNVTGNQQMSSGDNGAENNDDLEGFSLEQYDQETERSDPLAGIVSYASPLEDPLITNNIDSDEEDRDDLEIRSDDNLVVVAKVFKGDPVLEVYLYNAAEDDWYVHHDYILQDPPLSLEALSYDPGAENKRGNLLAVGTLKGTIDFWDLDLINASSPVLTLGTRSRSRRRRDGTAQGHSDAVLSLSWNHLNEHVMASGSADQTVILWDIEEAKAGSVLTHLDGIVQSTVWHPAENALLLTGTLNGQVGLTDCRTSDNFSGCWKTTGEIEQALWDHFNPFNFFIATNDGKLSYFDSRNDKAVFVVQAHNDSLNGISQSFMTKGLLCTCGMDNVLKTWKVHEANAELIASVDVNIGGLHVCRFSPDSGSIIAVGGEKHEMTKIVSVDEFEAVRSAFV